MMKHLTARSWAALLLTASLVACAGAPAAFAPRYPDNLEPELQTLVQRAAAGAQRSVTPIAVGVTSAGHLFGYELASKRTLWDVPAQARFTPLLAGDAVVIQESQRIVGIDLKTGAPRFQFDAGGMLLVGADGVGERAVIALTSGQGTFAASRVVFMSGATRLWEHTLNHPVGVPALAGDVVLVPWSSQYVSGLNAEDGDELARLRMRKGVVSHALVSRGQVFVGSANGLALLSKELLLGNLTSGPHYVPPEAELPGRPAFLNEVYVPAPLPAPNGAQSRVRLTWQGTLSSARQVHLSGDNLYLAFYRFVFALDPRTLGVRWIHTHPVDIVGARAQADGILIADAQGLFSALEAGSGEAAWQQKNAPSSVVDVVFPGEQNAASGRGAVSTVTNIDLRRQLAVAAQDPDSRLVPARLLAVQLLGKLQSPAATADLLGLCEDDRTTIAVRKAACAELRQRKIGNEYVLQALERRASYLAATSAPPVGALARAAAAQREKRAVPLLIAQLKDPNTPSEGLAEVVQSLGELGDPQAVPVLTRFLQLYHADPVDDQLALALAQVPAALVRLSGAGARAVIEAVANDPLAADGARAAAQTSLTKLDEQAAKATAEATPATTETAAETAQASAPAAPTPPAHITVDIIQQTLLPVHDPLQACLRSMKPDVFQARIVLVVEDGQVLMVSVLPEQLQSCIEPLVRSQTFPLTQLSRRDRVSYILKRF